MSIEGDGWTLLKSTNDFEWIENKIDRDSWYSKISKEYMDISLTIGRFIDPFKTMAKLHAVGLRLLTYPSHTQYLARGTFSYSQSSKRWMLSRRKSRRLRSILKQNTNRSTKMLTKIWKFSAIIGTIRFFKILHFAAVIFHTHFRLTLGHLFSG